MSAASGLVFVGGVGGVELGLEAADPFQQAARGLPGLFLLQAEVLGWIMVLELDGGFDDDVL